MVLHELATNAATYGALSAKHGLVSVRWDRRLNGQSRSYLVLDWRETGGPPVIAADNSGYGTSTIRDLLPYEFGGTVDLVFAPEGVQCRLELPADWLSEDADPVSGSSQARREIALVPADRGDSHRVTQKTRSDLFGAPIAQRML